VAAVGDTVATNVTCEPNVAEVDGVTDVNTVVVGVKFEITMSVFALSEPAAPGAGSVRLAGVEVESTIDPPFVDKALVDVYSSCELVCPANTVYRKVSVAVPEPEVKLAVPPEFSANCGVPLTVTGLLNVTVTEIWAPGK
jgi:hypothetical protein